MSKQNREISFSKRFFEHFIYLSRTRLLSRLSKLQKLTFKLRWTNWKCPKFQNSFSQYFTVFLRSFFWQKKDLKNTVKYCQNRIEKFHFLNDFSSILFICREHASCLVWANCKNWRSNCVGQTGNVQNFRILFPNILQCF